MDGCGRTGYRGGNIDDQDGIFSLENEFANNVRFKDEHVSPPSRRGMPPSVLVMY